MPERQSHEVVIKTDGAAIVSNETQCVTTSPVPPKAAIPSLADYVKRVRNMKNGVCYDQPFQQPVAVKPAKSEGPKESEKGKEKAPKLTPDR